MNKPLLNYIIATGVFSLVLNTTFSQKAVFKKEEGAAKQKGKSEWVYPGKENKLVYKTTPAGDKIMDFSGAGYMGGGVPLPVIPTTTTVKPTPGQDATKAIQEAIDAVAAMPLKNGFRGAVQLAAGEFTCNGTLTISASGIVLRGSGSGQGGTTIRMTGKKHPAIVISDGRKRTTNAVAQHNLKNISSKVNDLYVPSGAITLSIEDAAQFSIGDKVAIVKPVTDAWIHFMGMDNLVRDGKAQTWISKTRTEIFERKITAISGNKITLDMPLPDSYDPKYLNPPGMEMKKIEPNRITQVGVEDLHIQCPAQEVDYGHAPYSGIRIESDNCWVKNIYCEETMNTTTLAGNHITMQQVVIKHSYPNLGASKPTDFSIEGSGNLIDRCEVTGGNTYFVWTGSLATGPNVILNSVFRGRGSRIQPHQRWSTGLLIDNCVVPDGGIDFMNRGVAGSGHGWTMGWAVAWNCIAKTYIIQNPPGAINWAIGCTGRREQTARLFDSAPILPEGNFDSYGTPVTPQSLYLTQLAERLGSRAVENIGYSVYKGKMVTNENIAPFPPQKIIVDPVFGPDLAMYRPVNVSGVRDNKRQFGGEKALDGNNMTYWATNNGVTEGTFEVDTEGPLDINAIILSAPKIPGQKILKYKIEGQVDSDWKLLGTGTTIGKDELFHFPRTTVWKVRITILDAKGYVALDRVSLYLKKQ